MLGDLLPSNRSSERARIEDSLETMSSDASIPLAALAALPVSLLLHAQTCATV